ncbi:MAG: hypothetical protein NTU97_01420 [Candidatus Magasanikbacteria bacterium]|nr:hypothetical protein [Candidatus Magasanikbacteria bacterium]
MKTPSKNWGDVLYAEVVAIGITLNLFFICKWNEPANIWDVGGAFGACLVMLAFNILRCEVGQYKSAFLSAYLVAMLACSASIVTIQPQIAAVGIAACLIEAFIQIKKTVVISCLPPFWVGFSYGIQAIIVFSVLYFTLN